MSRLYVGVDGGATNTVALVSDGRRIVGRGTAGPSNHQVVGMVPAAAAVAAAVAAALSEAGGSPADVAAAVLGMAGADFPQDVEGIRAALSALAFPFAIVNDAEIALTAGLTGSGPAAVLVLAGTGTNVLGRHRDGWAFHIGGLGYPLGDLGGGGDLVKMALHRAFRAAEGRGPATSLTQAIPAALGVADFGALAEALYFGRIDEWVLGLLAPLIFREAARDRVCQDLLVAMGTSLGESAGAAVSRLQAHDPAAESVEVVLAGSLWFGDHPLLQDAFHLALHRVSARVWTHVSAVEPVVGALMAAVGGGGAAAALREQFLPPA